MVDKLEARAILAKAYRDNGDIGAANYIEAGHDLLPDTQVHLLAIRDALEARTPANGEQVERIAAAIGKADAAFGYSFNLTRLVDGEETHTLSMPGFDPIDFSDREEGYALIAERRNKVRADAIFATLSTPTEDARSRVKVLEEALRRICETETKWANATVRRMADIARTALGNKETDRHG